MVTYLTDVVILDVGLGKVKSKGNLNLAVLEYSVYSFWFDREPGTDKFFKAKFTVSHCMDKWTEQTRLLLQNLYCLILNT